MSAPDLHPEELLDKAAAGTLGGAERDFFNSHLAQCTACRFELQARRDFQSFESPGLNVDNLVAQALSGAPVSAVAASGGAARKLSRFALVALVLFVSMASFAAVATVTGVLPKLLEAISNPAPAVHPERAKRVEGPETSPSETVPVRLEPVAEGPEPRAPSPEQSVSSPKPLPRVARAEVRADKPPLPLVADTPDAGGLFALAHQARVQGDRPGAVRLYGELLEQFPGADEAKVAQAALGRLLLDTGDPQGALSQLDAYLHGGDATLREEVLAARATALSRLNRPRDEAAAWNTLLESYPDSVHAARARARLAELDPR